MFRITDKVTINPLIYNVPKWSGQKEKYSCFRKCGRPEKSLPGRPQIYFFQSILVEFFKYSLHFKDYSNCTFLCWKTKSTTFYRSKWKKHQFVWINLLVENRLNDKLYWLNVFHYGSKIQSLTWALHCRSQNLQPARDFEKHWWIWLLNIETLYLFQDEGKAFRVVKLFRSSCGKT